MVEQAEAIEGGATGPVARLEVQGPGLAVERDGYPPPAPGRPGRITNRPVMDPPVGPEDGPRVRDAARALRSAVGRADVVADAAWPFDQEPQQVFLRSLVFRDI